MDRASTSSKLGERSVRQDTWLWPFLWSLIANLFEWVTWIYFISRNWDTVVHCLWNGAWKVFYEEILYLVKLNSAFHLCFLKATQWEFLSLTNQPRLENRALPIWLANNTNKCIYWNVSHSKRKMCCGTRQKSLKNKWVWFVSSAALSWNTNFYTYNDQGRGGRLSGHSHWSPRSFRRVKSSVS